MIIFDDVFFCVAFAVISSSVTFQKSTDVLGLQNFASTNFARNHSGHDCIPSEIRTRPTAWMELPNVCLHTIPSPILVMQVFQLCNPPLSCTNRLLAQKKCPNHDANPAFCKLSWGRGLPLPTPSRYAPQASAAKVTRDLKREILGLRCFPWKYFVNPTLASNSKVEQTADHPTFPPPKTLFNRETNRYRHRNSKKSANSFSGILIRNKNMQVSYYSRETVCRKSLNSVGTLKDWRGGVGFLWLGRFTADEIRIHKKSIHKTMRIHMISSTGRGLNTILSIASM